MASEEFLLAQMQANEAALPLLWVKQKPKAKNGAREHDPTPRSGHTMAVIGANAYMFGGMAENNPGIPESEGHETGDASPVNDLYELKLASTGMEWMLVKLRGANPLPRWGHTMSLFDNTQLLIFGGFRNENMRLNDLWIFDVVKWGWSQPNKEHNKEASVPNAMNMTAWPNCPSPRGGHSATVFGDYIYIFGGYGGYGYSRRDLDDLYVLDTLEWTWNKVNAKGAPPEKRSGHSACAIERKIYIFGGWSASTQFNDLYILDLGSASEPGMIPAWSKVESTMEQPVWNMSTCSVVAIPTWKIFMFGGSSGVITDNDRQGKLLDDTMLLDAGEGTWRKPGLEGEIPTPRCGASMAYDSKNSRLLIFGGWSDRWHHEMFTLDVGTIVGPPYAITDIYPKFGPITGGIDVQITGIDFINTTDVVIRFGNRKNSVDVRGNFVAQTQLVCTSPDFTKFSPGTYDVRVALDGDSFTTTFAKFTFFSITNPFNSIMFGAGLLSGCATNEEVSFVIQARDDDMRNRTTGGDEYVVNVTLIGGGEDGEDMKIYGISIEDLEDGRYVVTYLAKYPGDYKIDVTYMGTFGGQVGPVRGSGVTITFDEFAPRDNNIMAGQLVVQSLKQDVAYLEQYTNEVSDRIFVRVKDESWTAEEQIRVLMNVKECLIDVQNKTPETNLIVDRAECIVAYLKEQGTVVPGVNDSLSDGKSSWEKILREGPQILARVSPMMRAHSSKIRADITAYEGHCKAYKEEVSNQPFKKYSTGIVASLEQITTADAFHSEEKETLAKMLHIANVFECLPEMDASKGIMDDVENILKDFRSLWETCQRCVDVIEEAKHIKWSELDSDAFDESSKGLVTSVRKLPKHIRTSDAFKGLDTTVKEFLSTCPLIVSLRSPAMRERHWRELMDVVKKQFTLPAKDPSMQLKDLLELGLHIYVNEVEEITEKASKESKHEETLANLETTWSLVEFAMQWYKDTDVPLLRLEDEAHEQLESDAMAVQSIVGSRYKHFAAGAVEWQKALTAISDVTTLLGEIQRTWSYLEPLFIGSEEVKRELPEDARRFLDIDTQVKSILQKAYKAKNVKVVCMQPGLMQKLQGLETAQDKCKKSLSEFLDGKRRQFPRFYFMSEADLLDLLSNSSQPQKVLVHVDKILLATKELTLQGSKGSDRPSASDWVAGVGKEKVLFDTPIPLMGKAEAYLLSLLQAQIYTLSRLLSSSIARYPQEPRIEWMSKKGPNGESMDPAQIILLVATMDFAQGVERAMRIYGDGDSKSIDKYYDKVKESLADLISHTQNSLSKGDRQRTMCMITLDAHDRDILEDLNRAQAFKPTDFQWMSKLRPKYLAEMKKGSGTASTARFSICDAKFDYGFEYLGNGPRLVVTPLTDRIYVTATQALNLHMGCAPAGPAGTGKTETTKDLASALGKCCYVFNCSPEMDYQSMGNIFKGLAASGSWGCFDEFNRLIPEVLSVCSVQFKAVCDGLKAYMANDDTTHNVTVEGDTVNLDPTCGSFITMNPGYLGRSELPEGLKALFRPITVIVPDLVLICENMLMAEGFQTAKVLASKFYGLYSLLKDLLSKQAHYDWGLRAVKSVLVVAGVLRRAEPDLAEDALLMRALRDFNIPKIVQADEVVFYGLLNDLFPGLNPKRVFDEELSECITMACEESGLWPDNFFTLKVMQLDELLDIRHCVFIMGPPGSGKSTCWKMLQAARNIRKPDAKTKAIDLNPKTMPTENLYGHISMATREWKDGLLSSLLRDLGRIPDENTKWMILDGDLDANWIESMNSVMDDNKMLTLASNERIPLKHYMRMIFEIRDLKYATPATVSRAGILYISMDGGSQWRSIIGSWVRHVSEDLMEDSDRERIHGLFEKYMPEILKYFASTLQTIVPMNDVSLSVNVLRLLDCMLTRPIIVDETALETTFVFCLIWGVGSVLTIADDGTDYRLMFSSWFRLKYKTVRIPTRDTVFDYWLDTEGSGRFEGWKDSPAFKEVEFDSTALNMQDVTVPTAETASISYWLDLLVRRRFNVMLAGPAGTGKTQLVNGLLGGLDKNDFIHCAVNMNFYTSAQVLQDALEAPLQKRTGSVFGPPGAQKMVYFIDDLNLPEVDKYGTQSGIALIRQHIDYNHWYDLSKLTIKTVDDCAYMGALNPTAGSFTIDNRLQRHFTTFAVGMPSPTSLLTIYETFLNGHMDSQSFSSLVAAACGSIIKGALALHKEVSETFRKTAANFHYEFNIRHIANVFAGLLVATPHIFSDAEKFVYLWLHESERVYGDRLVDYDDLEKFKQLLLGQARKIFPQYNVAKYYLSGGGVEADPLVFCHFADGNTQPEELQYDQGFSLNDMKKALDAALEEYNETNTTMNLVLFDDAVCHIARIVRIVKQTGGHALLVGVGGSGKQSLSRLSAFVCGYRCMSIMVNQHYGLLDFRTDLQAMYQIAGVKQEGVMFLITDTQITNEKFMVYMNDLLSSGDIPDLYNKDEKETIINSCTSKAKAAGYSSDPSEVWKFFISKIRENLHVCLCFSPVGPLLRTRARRFPALANCTVIDWFQPWPHQALQSVGSKQLAEVDLGEDDVRIAIEGFMPLAFTEVNKLCKKFLVDEGRAVYTTPKSYLEMLALYQLMLAQKRDETDKKIFRLQSGIEQLLKAAEAVEMLEKNLQVMLASAEEKAAAAAVIAAKANKEKAIVDVENEKAKKEEEGVASIQAEVATKQDDAANDLAKAEPMLEAALKALDSLDKKDLGTCKTMSKPPPGVDDIFGGVMVLLAGINPNIIVQKTGKVREKERNWDASKKALLGNVNAFLDELKGFKAVVDEGNVPDVNFKEIRPFLELEHFVPEVIEKRNSSAAGLCSWVRNIVQYADVVKEVEPKRQALEAANKELSSANERLEGVRARVAELQAKVDELTALYNEAEGQRKEAQDIADKGKMKLELANRLIVALGSEQVRWSAGVETFTNEKHLLIGDCLLASAFMSYFGPFTKPYRQQLFEIIQPLISLPKTGAPIPVTLDKDPVSVLCTEADIAEFQTQGLPADKVSSENGAIVLFSSRYPLMVDPQMQGIFWIKKRYGEELQISRLGQKDLVTRLMRSIELGQTFLLENMGEHIDPSIMPVIGRRETKRGTRKFMQLGELEVEIDPNFRLFLHTKLSNPHYPPEIQAETTLVNFAVTQQGLEDQLLAMVVKNERLDLAEQRRALILQQNLFTIRVQQLEDGILQRLSEAEGDITEDRALIEELELSKKISDDIAVKLEESKVTSVKIYATSETYRPVARRGALIFFAMNSLYKMHTYYMYSLNSFVYFFLRGIGAKANLASSDADMTTDLDQLEKEIAKRVTEIEARDLAEEGADLPARLVELQTNLTITVYDFVRSGLFERDKLTVVSLICLRVLVDEGKMDKILMDVIIRGRSSEDAPERGAELSKWISEGAWTRLKAVEEDLSEIEPLFQGLTETVANDAEEWEEWYNYQDPEVHEMPGDFKEATPIYRLILLRIIRPDRLPMALELFINSELGEAFTHQPPFSMKATYANTSNSTPVLFVLYPGVDPTSWVETYGKELGYTTANNRFANISMGQGQEARADDTVIKFSKDGGWVFLQNVHLMQTWLPTLEEKLETLTPHKDFRVFISAEPPALSYLKNIPEGLMQSCILISNEPPSDLKANLSRAWATFSQERIDGCSKSRPFKGCLFGLSFFHSVMLGRRRFGFQGWSRAYGFNMGDLRICADVMESYIEKSADDVPYQDLRYLFGEIMYGGHITDYFDRRTNNTYLKVIINPDILKKLSLADGLTAPDPLATNYDEYNTLIQKELPPEAPQIYGLHPNAEIGFLSSKAENLCQTILRLEVGSGSSEGGGQNSAQLVRETLTDLMERTPEQFNMVLLNDVANPRLGDDDGPYIVVVMQECTLINQLLKEIAASLEELLKGMNGQLNMSQKMEDMFECLLVNMVPGRNPFHLCSWERLAWASRKNLATWFADMLLRKQQLEEWTQALVLPYSIWLPGLINPTSLLTAVKQVTARKNGLPLDNMSLDTYVTRMTRPQDAISNAVYPEDGVFVHGLMMEGARWTDEEESVDNMYVVSNTQCAGNIVESHLKQLLDYMPLIYVKAVEVQSDWSPESVGYLRGDPNLYECPVYTTSSRGPTFVFLATLNSLDPTSKWVLAGVALLMQSDD